MNEEALAHWGAVAPKKKCKTLAYESINFTSVTAILLSWLILKMQRVWSFETSGHIRAVTLANIGIMLIT